MEFGEETEELILDLATDHEQEQRRCSASYSGKKMVQHDLRKVHSLSTITKLKSVMKFNMIKFILHPALNESTWLNGYRLPLCTRSIVTLDSIKAAGFTEIDQPPRSLDFNLLDALLFRNGALVHLAGGHNKGRY